MSLEEMYTSDVERLGKVIELQRQIIKKQEQMLENKDGIISILTQQKSILAETLKEIRAHI